MKILVGLPDTMSAELASGNMKAVQAISVHSFEQYQYKLDDQYEKIVLHCDLFATVYPWEWMQELKRRHPHVPVAVILSEGVYDSIMSDIVCRLAVDFEMTVIPQSLTADELAEVIKYFVTGEQRQFPVRGTLIAVMSAAPQDGATTIAVNTAIELARMTSLQVGVLDLNLWSPVLKDVLNMPAQGRDLLTLRPRLASRTLTSEDLLQHCVSSRSYANLKWLFGTSRRDTAPDLSMEQVRILLDTAKSTFDVTLVDVHTLPNNAATVYSVKHADERWLVTQPVYTSFKTSWPDWFECYWRHCGLTAKDFSMIINRYDPSGKIKKSAIEASTGLNSIAEIANVGGGMGIKAVNDGQPLLLQTNNEQFVRDIRRLTEKIAAGLGIHTLGADAANRTPLLKKWLNRLLN
ncbi:hypothetical protein B5M42_000030 [Paenibacillus athensensis]|uniref:Uncharacterized protein n=1 Tax=Paenibacillus athensensis TaxID=1967502 RepID=A0A4Y8PSD4_9BACL|nr:hypothetical protein [Paenibacillus athensensis]MCD1257221.1 hypothetical protein [Paenibacillus athensensis]